MKYIIQSLINQGFWSSSYKDFKGILYVSSFNSIKEAETEILNKELKNITIIPYYK